jgi:prefoldin subunit 5
VFFICGLLQVIFAILLVTKGVNNLQQTTDTIQISTHSIRLLINEADKVTKDLEQVAETSTILRDQIVFDLDKDTFCPANPVFAEAQIGVSIVGAAAGAIQVLHNMGDIVTDNVAVLEESMASAKRNLDSVDQSLENVENYEWLGERPLPCSK